MKRYGTAQSVPGVYREARMRNKAGSRWSFGQRFAHMVIGAVFAFVLVLLFAANWGERAGTRRAFPESRQKSVKSSYEKPDAALQAASIDESRQNSLILNMPKWMIGYFSRTPGSPLRHKYYKSIRIEPGDTLEAIAEVYISHEYASLDSYVDEVRSINGLNYRERPLIAGAYLIVPYWGDGPKD